MDEADLRRQVEELGRRLSETNAGLARLVQRVAALEEGTLTSAEPEPAVLNAEPLVPSLPKGEDGASVVASLGRLLVVLGGAYLIRAGSETGAVPTLVGALAGLVYAAWWLGRCDRSAAAGARVDAAFHGFAAALVAFPLIFEVTARFGVFPVWVGCALVVIAFALSLRVAVRRGLPELAWTVTLLAAGVCVGLIQATHDVVPPTLGLLALAALGESQALEKHWFGLRWPLALAANLAVLLVVALTAREAGLPEAYVPFSATVALGLELGLAALYVGSVAIRTLNRRRRISVFAMLQVPTALALGLGGAAWTADRAGVGSAAVGLLALLLGAVSYAVAFPFAPRGVAGGRNFYFYSTLAAALTLAGWPLLLSGLGLAVAWLLAGVVAGAAAVRLDRVSIAAQALVFLAGGAVTAGAIGAAQDGFLAPAAVAWRGFDVVALLAAGVVALAYGVLVRAGDARRWRFVQGGVGTLASFLLAGAVAQLAVGLLRPGEDAGFVAAIRTGVLAVAAVGLAAGQRWTWLRGLGFLVTPLLVLGGMKLAFEDLRLGRPATLFLSLVLYGGALTLAPRLLRRDRRG